MARTKQIARMATGPASAQKPMNSGSMRISPYIQKSKPEKTKKPKVKKDKTAKAAKPGDKSPDGEKIDQDLPERCKSVEECKCLYGCFSPPSSPCEVPSSSDSEESDSEESGSECEQNKDCTAEEEEKK
jgi:hypothetical protein